MGSHENTVYSAAYIIWSGIKSIKDTMYWPPQAVDINIKNINFGDILSAFWNITLSGKASLRVARLEFH